MKTMKTFLSAILIVLTVSVFGFASATPVADMTIGSSYITWQPRVEYKQLVLNVSCPDGSVISKTFDGYAAPNFELSSVTSRMIEGSYTYELIVVPKAVNQERGEVYRQEKLSQTGHFMVMGSSFVSPLGGSEDLAATSADVHNVDTIITGSLCVGYDCSTSEAFGSDTIRIKENNVRIHFEDTSTSASFPGNDWRLIANDSTNGGANYFAIQDSSASKTPFKIEAGAVNNALYIDDNERVGLGTAAPVVELHIVEGDTPTVRLDQDSSHGWSTQIWDVAGNETNFFIRDVTGGSKLFFRAQPGTPENTLTLRSTGYVGIGTWTPDYQLEVEETGTAAIIAASRTDATTGTGPVTAIVKATGDNGFIGTASDHSLRLAVSNAWKLELASDNSLTMASGASCTSGGTWTNASSRELKEDITELDSQEAMAAFKSLKPVTYKYKAEKDETYVGFIAEDVPQLVAQKDRKSISTMDVVALLTKVVQEQQETLDKQQQTIEELKKEIMKRK